MSKLRACYILLTFYRPTNSEIMSSHLEKSNNAEDAIDTEIELENVAEMPKEIDSNTMETTLAAWIERFQLLKEVIISVAIFCVFIGVCFVFYTEWQRKPVIIEPLAVPESFVQNGYSGSVLASRLMDQLAANRAASYNQLPDDQKYLFPDLDVTNSGVEDTLNMEVPDTGMSLNVIIQYIRSVRGSATHVSGDLVGDKNNFELTIRVNGNPKIVKGNLNTLNTNMDVLSEHIMENIQPFFLALQYYGEKNYDKALEVIQIAINNNDEGDDSLAYNLWGNILARKKQYNKAIEKYNQSIEANPDNDSPYIGLGYIYYRGYKNYDEAINSYETVINRNNKNYSAYNDLALVLAEKGDSKAAIENYKKAIAANPSYANAYYNLGLIFLTNKDYKQAIIQFNKIIELPYSEKNYFKAYNGLCYSLSQEGNYNEAISDCELAIKIKPKDDNIYDTLGTVYLTQKDYTNALKNYQIAVDYNAENSEAQQHLAEVLAILRRCEEANTHLELALKLDNTIKKENVEKYCKNSVEKNQ